MALITQKRIRQVALVNKFLQRLGRVGRQPVNLNAPLFKSLYQQLKLSRFDNSSGGARLGITEKNLWPATTETLNVSVVVGKRHVT